MSKGLFFLVLAVCLANPAWAFMARAKSVHDGDSIQVRRKSGSLVNVRLYGIDAPELMQPSGRDAQKLLASLAARRPLNVQPVDKDRYGRTVALVRLPDGTLLNEVMVAEGLAWVYDQYCQEALCPGLRELESQARTERRGLWAVANPTRPSEWRREHKTEEWYLAPVRAMKKMARNLRF